MSCSGLLQENEKNNHLLCTAALVKGHFEAGAFTSCSSGQPLLWCGCLQREAGVRLHISQHWGHASLQVLQGRPCKHEAIMEIAWKSDKETAESIPAFLIALALHLAGQKLTQRLLLPRVSCASQALFLLRNETQISLKLLHCFQT